MPKVNVSKEGSQLTAGFQINSLAFSPDQKLFAMSGIEATGILVKSLASDEVVAHLPYETTAIVANGIRWGKLGHIAAIHQIGSRSVRVWDSKDYHPLLDIDVEPYRGAVTIDFDASGRYLAVACRSNPKTQPCLIVADLVTLETRAYSAPVYPLAMAWHEEVLLIAGELLSPDDAIGLVAIAPRMSEPVRSITVLLEADASDLGIIVHPVSGGIVVSAFREDESSSYTTLSRLQIGPLGEIDSLQPNFVPGKATLFGFLDADTIALDFFDETDAPLKLLCLSDNSSVEVDLGTPYTSEAYALDGGKLAIGIGKEALVFSVEEGLEGKVEAQGEDRPPAPRPSAPALR